MVLLDNYIRNVLKESIDNVLNNRKLYHQTSNDFNVIKSILMNGLQPNDSELHPPKGECFLFQ